MLGEDVDVFRKTVDEVPTFGKARTSFEDDPVIGCSCCYFGAALRARSEGACAGGDG